MLHATLVNLRDLTAKLNERVTPLAESLTQTSNQAGATFADLSTLMQNEQGDVVHLAESIERTADRATEMLEQADNALSGVDGEDLRSLIQELSEAARSIRIFANYLERHPEALLRGKN